MPRGGAGQSARPACASGHAEGLIEVKDEKSRRVITSAGFSLNGGAMHAQEVAPNVRGAPAVAAGIKVERVAFDAPWAWLAAGWRDLWVAPRISLTYGAVFAAVSMGLTLALRAGGLEALVLSLGGGFLLIGPIAAIGIYETSRRIEAGQPVTFRDIARRRLPCAGPARLLWRDPRLRLFCLAPACAPAVHALPRATSRCRRPANSSRRYCSRRMVSDCS